MEEPAAFWFIIDAPGGGGIGGGSGGGCIGPAVLIGDSDEPDVRDESVEDDEEEEEVEEVMRGVVGVSRRVVTLN